MNHCGHTKNNGSQISLFWDNIQEMQTLSFTGDLDTAQYPA